MFTVKCALEEELNQTARDDFFKISSTANQLAKNKNRKLYTVHGRQTNFSSPSRGAQVHDIFNIPKTL